MPVKLRIKGTDKFLHMNSGKYIWNAAGHAKASMTTSGLSYSSMRELLEAFPDHPYLKERRHSYRNSIPFDKVSDVVEVMEYKLEKPGALKDALVLIKDLREALWHADVEGMEAGLIAKAAQFAKEHE